MANVGCLGPAILRKLGIHVASDVGRSIRFGRKCSLDVCSVSPRVYCGVARSIAIIYCVGARSGLRCCLLCV